MLKIGQTLRNLYRRHLKHHHNASPRLVALLTQFHHHTPRLLLPLHKNLMRRKNLVTASQHSGGAGSLYYRTSGCSELLTALPPLIRPSIT